MGSAKAVAAQSSMAAAGNGLIRFCRGSLPLNSVVSRLLEHNDGELDTAVGLTADRRGIAGNGPLRAVSLAWSRSGAMPRLMRYRRHLPPLDPASAVDVDHTIIDMCSDHR